MTMALDASAGMVVAARETMPPRRLSAAQRSLSLAVPASVALHGVVVAAIAFGWQLGSEAVPMDVPMDVVVVSEPASAIEAPEIQEGRAAVAAEMPTPSEPPPPVQASELAPPVPTYQEVAVALPMPESLPPAVTELAFAVPLPPPVPPQPKPVKPKPKAVAAPPPPPPPAPPVRDVAREIAAAALPPVGDPGPPQYATSPAPRPEPAVAAAASPSFRGLPLVTEARFREPPRQPVYPRRAIDLDQKGTVVVRALVDPSGNPAAIEIWNSSGHPLLDRAAEQAVRQWRFQPATYNARPTEAWVQVAVHFNLR